MNTSRFVRTLVMGSRLRENDSDNQLFMNTPPFTWMVCPVM